MSALTSAWTPRCYEPLLRRVLAPLRTLAAQCCAGAGTGGQVLDVCCGPGGLRPYLEQRGLAVAGIDLDMSMLHEARRRENAGPGRTWPSLWAQADARQLPFADSSFEVAVVCLALHAMPGDASTEVLAHMRRVAKRVVIADYCLPERNMALPGYGLACAVERLVGGEHYRCYREFMHRGALEGLLHSQGFPVARREYALGGAVMVAVLQVRPTAPEYHSQMPGLTRPRKSSLLTSTASYCHILGG